MNWTDATPDSFRKISSARPFQRIHRNIFRVAACCAFAAVLLLTSLTAMGQLPGSALNLNGINGFVRVGANPIPTTGNFTIECWVNAPTNALGSYREIISQAVLNNYPRFYLGIDPNGQIRGGDDWIATGATLPMGAWHHVALVCTNDNAFLYLDGALAATRGSAMAHPTAAPWMDIGQQYGNFGEFWLGQIDELRIWNVARSQAQIQSAMNVLLAGNDAGLVAYYRFNEGVNSTTANSATATGSAFNGTLVNGSSWAATPNDAFASRLAIIGLAQTNLGYSLNASKEVGEPNHVSAGGRSVWWTWTAPANARVTLDTLGSSFDTLLAVYTGNSVSNLALVTSDDDSAGNFKSRVSFAANGGTTYQIAVDGFNAAGGSIVLNFVALPPNDTFTNSVPISGSSVSVAGFNVNATKEPGEPNHYTVGGKSVWWSWTAPADATVTIDTIGSSFDTLLAVYLGNSVTNLAVIASDDDSGGATRSRVTFGAIGGTTYRIAVDGYSGASGTILLNLAAGGQVPVPGNDLFSNRISIFGFSTSVAGYNAAATKEAGEPNHGGSPGGRSVWWSWTAPADATVTIDTIGSSFDTLLGVYVGNSVTSLAVIASDDDSGGANRSKVIFGALAGTTYQIAVDGFSAISGSIVLNLVAAPPNDSFTNRITISGAAAVVTGYNVNASKEPGEPAHAGNAGGRSVWWTWTAPATGTITIDTLGSSFDTLLAVYLGSSVSNLVAVASDDNSAGGGNARVTFQASAGTTYQIALDGAGGVSGNITLNFGAAPPNDSFTNRIAISGLSASVTGTNANASKEAGEPNHAGNFGGRSVWWKWTAPANARVTIDTIGSSFDTILAVYTGSSVSSLTLVASDDDGAGNLKSRVSFLAIAGTTYQIAVDGFGGANGSIVLNLEAVPGVSSSDAGYAFTTLAGEPGAGGADGIGDRAKFFEPAAAAMDGAGNLYVADTYNHTIRKVTPAGVVTTIAGLAGEHGSTNGTGSNARFFYPSGIAVDGGTNVYVADFYNHTIRKIAPIGTNWVVTTIAGTAGSYGSADDVGNNAQFFFPFGLAIDGGTNLYVADTYNLTIRKITPVGTNWVVTTIAGTAGSYGSSNGTNGNAQFNYPFGIAVDRGTNLYVADTYNLMIRKITPAGTNWVVTTLAGSPGGYGSTDDTGSNARFAYPYGIAVDNATNVYVADTYNLTIRKVTPAGVVSTVAGLAGSYGSTDGTGGHARFNLPLGIAVGGGTNLFVPDSANNTIRKITSAGVVSTIAGFAGSAGSTDGTLSTARFNNPQGVAVDPAGNLYVADSYNSTIRKVTSVGVVTTIAGLAGTPGTANGAGSDAQFNRPYGVALDTNGNIFVADTYNHIIRKITSAGVVSTFAGSAGVAGTTNGQGVSAQFNLPNGIAVDGAGNVYVADTGNNTIRKITSGGFVTTLAGLAGAAGSSDKTGGDARFSSPTGIAVDSVGTLYVADTANHTIRKITAVGAVTTIAGLAGTAGTNDNVGTDARFSNPTGIAVDSGGNVYVTESSAGNFLQSSGNTIRKISPVDKGWVVRRIGGLPGTPGSADGAGNVARFRQPSGIAVDLGGNLYVGDTGNNTIRLGSYAQFTSLSILPYTAPAMNGQLTVTLLPPEANGQWRFPWESGWHNSGDTVTSLPVPYNYTIEFRNVPGYLTFPQNESVPLDLGQSASITHYYYPTISEGGTNAGSLTVSFGSVPPAGAGWRFLAGDNNTNAFYPPGYTAILAPGIYLIEFQAVSNRVTPASQSVQVNAGSPSFLTVNYLIASAAPGGVLLPQLVPTNQVSDLDHFPFGFNGQLIADTRHGSGVVVQPNVVLSAAHLVFDDQTLSFVSHAYWFLRRDKSISEPLPQEARSFYLLSGYAAQRTNDLGSGLYSPDQSSAPSRNFDVAVLYFSQPVAAGGYGGYLPSDAVPNTWLASTALKMLVGYPVDGSQFGNAGINDNAGRMYQTDPQPLPLTLATDPVANQQVYTASWFLSYPGNSGGPLYVQLNDRYYPAGVYLGTLFNGSQPYGSLVRAIDSNVVNLITLAASQGDSATNYTLGGVSTIVPSQFISAKNPGYLQVRLTPSAAVLAGAGWRLQGDTNTPYSSQTNFTLQINSTNVFALEFKPVAGWKLPTNPLVNVYPNPTNPTVISAFYMVNDPLLAINRATGIGITGTTGTIYRLERKSALSSSVWLAVTTNTIRSNGINPILTFPTTNQPGFYRAVWLP